VSNTENSIPLHDVWHYTDVDRRFWEEHLESWLPRRIFDAHTHVNEPQYLVVKMTEEKRRQFWVNEVAEPIGAAAAGHCHETVFPGREFSCLVFGHPSLDFDIEGSNASLQAECADRDWYRLAVVKPQWSPQRVAGELDQAGVLGVKVYYSMISDDPKTRDKHLEASIFEFLPHEQLELLNARRAWLTLHVPKADRLGQPDNIREIKQIRDQYPNIVLVIAHIALRWRCSVPAESYTVPTTPSSTCADDAPGVADLTSTTPTIRSTSISTASRRRWKHNTRSTCTRPYAPSNRLARTWTCLERTSRQFSPATHDA
jgi:hypothetical protein